MLSPLRFLPLFIFSSAFPLAAAPLALDIKNPSFEQDKTTLNGDGDGIPIGSDPGDFTAGIIPQWTASAAGLFNPNAPVNFAPDGNLVSFLDNGGVITQPLVFPNGSAVTATPGIRVSVAAKARGRTGGQPNTQLNLRVGAVPVSTEAAIMSIPANATGYSDVSASVTVAGAAALGANANQPLTLVMSNAGHQLNIDSVSASVVYLPFVSSISAAPTPATAGQPVTVSWNVSNATSLVFNGQDVTGLSSTVLTAPAIPTSYTLEATNSDGTASAQVLIDVLPASLAAPEVRINEVMTQNIGSIMDEDNTRQDWIELHNPTGAAVNLTGWHLTDDRDLPQKWTFPATQIPAGGYLLVFASGKARTTSPLHTNFSLNSDGEYLALTNSSGTVVHAMAPIPKLLPNQTYGPGTGPTRNLLSLSPSNAALKWLVPSAAVSDDWRGAVPFADASWANGQWDLGYKTTMVNPYLIAAGTVGFQTYAGSLGMDFEVLRPIQVTDLMCFDSGSNGLSRTITTVLWSRNQNGTAGSTADDLQGTVLASEVFSTASPGTLVGGQRVKPLAAPLNLPVGSYTILAYNYGAGEPNGNDAAFNNTTDSGGGALQFVGSSRYGVTAPPASVAASWPGTSDGGPAARYGSGSFRFREVAAFGTSTETAMRTVNASVLTRTAFSLAPGQQPQCPILTVTYDDGFVAWINGMEVARRNAPAALNFNSAATTAALATESISLASIPGIFQSGTNVLAIQGLNASAADADFRLQASLSAEDSGTVLAYLSSATPNAANSSGALSLQPTINEIHSDPIDSKSRFTEFVEIYNPLGTALNLGGWRLTGGLEYVIPANTMVPPCGYLVIAENPSHLQTYLGHTGAVGPWVGGLKNDGDTVQLRNPALEVVDEVAYELGFPWPTVGDDPGNSLQRIHEGLDSNLGGSWRGALPTPGQRNSVTTGAVPPAIRQVDHFPIAPASNEAVLISAKITDPDGVAAAWLEYQIVEPGNYIRLADPDWATKWITLPMTDDGNTGDVTARDTVFTATIPASVQTHRRLVRYRVRSWDGNLVSVRVPYADEDCPNFAYFVYDGVPAWSAAVQPGVTAATAFSNTTMGKVRPWHLLSNATDVQNCQYNAAYNDGTYRFEGALVIDGKVYDHIHYRIKGQNSTFNTGKNKWKLQFNRGHYLKMPDDYGRVKTTVKTLNISSVPAPWAPWNRGMHGLDEAMAFRLSNLAGVPSPRTSYVHWRVIDGAVETNPGNQFDGDFWGLYLAFENTDNNFKEEHNLPDGNVYRLMGNETGNRILGQGKGQVGDLSDLNNFISTTVGYRTGGGTATVAPLVSAIKNEQWFRDNVNMPGYYNWRAVTEAINQTDRREQENVVYLRHPAPPLGDGRWNILPWDCDLLYENFDRWGPQSVQTAINLQQYEQISRSLLHPNLLTEFQNRSRELQDLLLNSDQAWKVVDEFISIITDETPRIIPNGGPIADGLVEAERRRWDYNPTNPTPPRGAGPTGNYYKNPYPIGNMSNGPPQPYNRVLASGDFEGMVKWVKDFIATGQNGGGRLSKMAKGEIAPYTLATTTAIQIPATPVITYSGPVGYPLNQLQFTSSGFASPNGQTFTGQQWRIGEIYDPSVPGFLAGEPWKYEIENIWTSAEVAAFSASMPFPPDGLAVGKTYRARTRHKDSLGRWSHWSAPVQFQAGAAVLGNAELNLVISEIHYHPADEPTLTLFDGDEYEFIEFMNIHPTAQISTDSLAMTDGVTLLLPNGLLNPGERVVIVRNLTAFRQKYGATPRVIGQYTDGLRNSGETLVLGIGTTPIRTVPYLDSFPWPNSADGGGASLVLIAPQTNPDHSLPQNWRPSAVSGGTPGTADTTTFGGTATTDADQDGFDALAEYAMGTSDAATDSGLPQLQTEWIEGKPVLTWQRSLAADDILYIIETSSDLTTWIPAQSNLLDETRNGPNWTLQHEITPPDPSQRFYVRLRFQKRL